MNLTASSFARLLGALEDLAAQESIQLAGRNFVAVRQTQERAAPLVTELARLGGEAVPASLRPRLEALLARRQLNQTRLEDEIIQTRDALLRAQASQRRVARIAPAYRGQAAASMQRQLSALG